MCTKQNTERERGGGEEEERRGEREGQRMREKDGRRERANVYAVINIHTQMMVLTCA